MLLLGLDPNLDLLPPEFFSEAGSDISSQLRYFCFQSLDAAKGLISGIKPQSAYFEKYGLSGLKVLSELIQKAGQEGFSVTLDAKRGDIDRTSRAYAEAYLKPETDFTADFLTVNPFLGTKEALQPFVDVAVENGKGLFVLVKTSNPGAEEIQSFTNSNGQNLTSYLATQIEKINKDYLEKGYLNKFWGSGYGPIGAVVGSTKIEISKGLRIAMPHTWFLCPGLGTQGGKYEDIPNFLNPDKKGAWFPMSSGLTNVSGDEILTAGNFRNAVRNRIEATLARLP